LGFGEIENSRDEMLENGEFYKVIFRYNTFLLGIKETASFKQGLGFRIRWRKTIIKAALIKKIFYSTKEKRKYILNTLNK